MNPEEEKALPFLFHRILETIGTELLSSLIFSLIFYLGLLKQTTFACVLVMLLCVVINAVRLKNCLVNFLYCGFRGRAYYKTNFTVMLILLILSTIFAALNIEPLFTILFLPFKLLYIIFGVPKILSALILNGILVLITAVVPMIYTADIEFFEELDELDYGL